MKAYAKKHPVIFAIMLIMIAAIYLNIGWAFGTYVSGHLSVGADQTQYNAFEKFLLGPNGVMFGGTATLQSFQIFLALLWPLWFTILIISWVCSIIYTMLWLIFAGGIAKLLGVG